MPAKLRLYVLLTFCCGVVLIGLYKLLNGKPDAVIRQELSAVTDLHVDNLKLIPLRIPQHVTLPTVSSSSSSPHTPLNPMKNVNELLAITQPSHHLHRQKLREQEFHAKMKESLVRKYFPTNIPYSDEKYHPVLNHRLVHLDLKGAPPQMSYFKKLFPLLKSVKATGLLVEYEDMFPYHGSIGSFKAYNAYSKTDLKNFLNMAHENGLEVIPLVQTFGHLEFVLKQHQFMDLREVPEYPQVVCPSNNQTVRVLQEMIDQVIAFHPNLKWIHIGADEVYYLGRCERCQIRMQKKRWDLDTLFIQHVLDTAKYIKEKHGIQPIMWDDMFRTISIENIRASKVNKYVDLMVWIYSSDVNTKIDLNVWEKYQELFPGIWAASVFKGASGPKAFFPNTKDFVSNHRSWMTLISHLQKKSPFRGIAMTGWQRYDHFSLLCELLPVALPSLVLNLVFIDEGGTDSHLVNRTKRILNCQDNFNITWNFDDEFVKCQFPGARIFLGAQKLGQLQSKIREAEGNNNMVGWMSEYQVRMKFSSPARVEIATDQLQQLVRNTSMLYNLMEKALLEVYDNYTTHEWLEFSMEPIVKKLKDWKHRSDVLLKYPSWPRRPIINSEIMQNPLKELAMLIRPNEH